MALILLTNDDGVDAEGLRRLEECVRDLAETVVVAPDRERSAVGHGLTVHSPLALNKINSNRYTLNGTPADCILYALTHVTNLPPDLVISGINHGANMGDEIVYSGTVAAAREASRHGIPSLAISQAYDDKPIRFKGMKFVRTLIKAMLEKRPRGAVCLNVNIPVRRIRGVKVTRQGCSRDFPHYNYPGREAQPGRATDHVKSDFPLDYRAVVDHYISVTPLQRDQTDYLTAQSMVEEIPKLFAGLRFTGIPLIGRTK